MTETAFDPTSRKTEAQANGFESTRLAHQSEMAEDYVELIAELIEQNGEARPVDIAERLRVSQPTVSKNLNRLKRDRLVTHAPYRAVFLTDEGMVLAETCRKRHRIVVSFLKALGVPADSRVVRIGHTYRRPLRDRRWPVHRRAAIRNV